MPSYSTQTFEPFKRSGSRRTCAFQSPVHLIDPVEIHLEQAKARSAASGTTLGSITKGDARRLGAQSNSADAVLLLGPLYHLVDRSDRLMALREARILKPKGVLIAAAVSRFASLIDGLARGFFRDSDFRKIVANDLATGQHRNPTNQTAYFTTAYFHRPEELAAEVREASFAGIQIFAVEGPVWSTAHLGEAWDDPVQRKSLMEFLALIERESSAHGASAHLVAVATQPDSNRCQARSGDSLPDYGSCRFHSWRQRWRAQDVSPKRPRKGTERLWRRECRSCGYVCRS